jgi:hypothetical protein
MATASLKLPITDVLGEPILGTVNVDFEPERSANGGAGGARMETGKIDLEGAKELTVENIECLGGQGTLYRVAVESKNYRTYSFFQRIVEGKVNKPPDNQIPLVVNPGKVRDIDAPAFDRLPAKLKAFLSAANPIAREAEDRDLEGLSGEALYNALGPLRKAGLLNLYTKAKHGSASGVARFLDGQTLLVLRQDRFFSTIDPGVEKVLNDRDIFKSAPNLLHKPLPGFELHDSFKTRDAHANLQVTLMRDTSNGSLAADIDIDESSGIEHGFEVIRNTFKGRTNPYLIRELLLLADLKERTIDPGYRFIFS